MNETTIEWVVDPDGTRGATLNLVTGCPNGCPYCYARDMARHGRVRPLYLSNTNVAPGFEPRDAFSPRLWPERFAQLSARQAPRGIFMCDMGELFGPWLPREWIHQVMEAIKGCPQHRFYLLTKQGQELEKWTPFPRNAWVGVSAWDGESLSDACHYLGKIDAKVKYISLEPLLAWPPELDAAGFQWEMDSADVRWLIVGAQSNGRAVPRYLYPERKWVEQIIRGCEDTGIAVFLKNSLRYAYDGGWPQEPFFWHDPEDPHSWNLLQEFPDGKVIVGDRAIPRENVAAEIQRLETRA